MWEYNYTSELYHYGVLGMKWGVRRYQHKDGSLTLLGRRRIRKMVKMREEYNKYAQEFNNIKNASGNTGQEQSSKPKTVKDMSDEELASSIRRLQMEKQFAELTKAPEVKKGKTFTSQLMDGLKTKAASELSDFAAKQGRTLVENMLGINTKPAVSEEERLKKEYMVLNYKKNIKNLKSELGE